MDWYKIYSFRERLLLLEQFLIEIAAHEDYLIAYGFGRVLEFQGADPAIEALKSFGEEFGSFRRGISRIDRTLGQELERLDTDGKLVEQIALISLKLRMSLVNREGSAARSALRKLALDFPYLFRRRRDVGVLGQDVSLHKTIINVGRLGGLATSAYTLLSNMGVSDDEVFKPSNISSDHVIDLIDAAILQIELVSISPTERVRLVGYLEEAKKETVSQSPSWSKVVGALVIAAAIISGIADAPEASKTIKDVVEYILGTSVEKELPKCIAPPQPDIDTNSQGSSTFLV